MKRTCCTGLSTASTVEKAAVSAILILLNAAPVSLGQQNPAEREAVAGRPSRAFPCSYEPLSARDPQCRRRNEATAPIASSSFAAADGVRGRLRDGPRPALRGRALRAPPRKSWPAPFSAGNSALSALSRVLLGDRTCLCLPNTRPRTHPPRHPARRRPRCCRPASSL